MPDVYGSYPATSWNSMIDQSGQQWKHCHCCTRFVKIETLWFEEPSDEFRHGRDICADCAGGNLMFGTPKLCNRLVPPGPLMRISR